MAQTKKFYRECPGCNYRTYVCADGIRRNIAWYCTMAENHEGDHYMILDFRCTECNYYNSQKHSAVALHVQVSEPA